MNFSNRVNCTSRNPNKLTISTPLIQAHISATSFSLSLLYLTTRARLAMARVLLISRSTSTYSWCTYLVSTAELMFVGLFIMAISISFVLRPELSIFQRQRRPASSCNLNPVWVRNSFVKTDFFSVAPTLSSSITNLTFCVRSNSGKYKRETLEIQCTRTSTLRQQLACGAWMKCCGFPDTLKGSRWYWESPTSADMRWLFSQATRVTKGSRGETEHVRTRRSRVNGGNICSETFIFQSKSVSIIYSKTFKSRGSILKLKWSLCLEVEQSPVF